jgi:hypothetical protein
LSSKCTTSWVLSTTTGDFLLILFYSILSYFSFYSASVFSFLPME